MLLNQYLYFHIPVLWTQNWALKLWIRCCSCRPFLGTTFPVCFLKIHYLIESLNHSFLFFVVCVRCCAKNKVPKIIINNILLFEPQKRRVSYALNILNQTSNLLNCKRKHTKKLIITKWKGYSFYAELILVW